MKNFQIEILDQYWVTKDLEDKNDLCSHGLIHLRVNNTTVSNEKDDDWTISTTGLMLLRTVSNNHNVDSSFPIIQHCGQLAMLGCPISIDWTVEHNGDKVIIKEIKKYPTTDEKDVIEYNENVAVERKKYIREIIRFCDTIKEYFKDKPRNFSDEYSKQEWLSFWAEFDMLLSKHRMELKE